MAAGVKAQNQKRTKVELALMVLVAISIVRQFFLGNYHNMFLGILTLLLFMVPKLIEKKLRVEIPIGLETVILVFIFCAEILEKSMPFMSESLSGIPFYIRPMDF